MTTPEDDSGGRPYIPPRSDLDDIVIRSADGTVLRRVALPPLRNVEEGMSRMHEAFARMAEMLEALPRFEVPRGGFSYEPGWIPPSYRKRDPRKGDDIEVRVLVPGDKVFILEGVFTVHRVDMKAPIPTVWLEELPDSPLYFADTDYIPLAKEPED
jgi:hypothetical protein